MATAVLHNLAKQLSDNEAKKKKNKQSRIYDKT